ncbi:MAG: c-type cytochrome biogenesis protein CcmI [Cucumibacter sp.]
MSVWLAAILLTALCCAALYYAATRPPVNARAASKSSGPVGLYRAQLGELDRDLAAGTIAFADAEAARAEMGRELLRGENEWRAMPRPRGSRWSPLLALPIVAILGLATYGLIGRPELPGQPAAGRPEIAARNDLIEAVAGVEERLRAAPDDLAGWEVIAPVYLRIGRAADAVAAFRQVVALGGVSAERQTDLAEALIAENGGEATGEALSLLRAAAADPAGARARYYLASEATSAGRYAEARTLWEEVIAIGPADAPWLESAREALGFVEAKLAEGGE